MIEDCRQLRQGERSVDVDETEFIIQIFELKYRDMTSIFYDGIYVHVYLFIYMHICINVHKNIDINIYIRMYLYINIIYNLNFDFPS